MFAVSAVDDYDDLKRKYAESQIHVSIANGGYRCLVDKPVSLMHIEIRMLWIYLTGRQC